MSFDCMFDNEWRSQGRVKRPVLPLTKPVGRSADFFFKLIISALFIHVPVDKKICLRHCK